MTIKSEAFHTCLQRLPMIRDKITTLRHQADDHFNHDPDAIHWGDVGDLGRVDRALDALLSTFEGLAKS